MILSTRMTKMLLFLILFFEVSLSLSLKIKCNVDFMRKVVLIFINIVVLNCIVSAKIDREKLVNRNSPINNQIDSLSSLSVGNGEFAYTVDITGLQTFPEKYKQGVPLGTQAQWGWHSFPNIENFEFQETLKNYDFRGRNEPYAVQMKEELKMLLNTSG